MKKWKSLLSNAPKKVLVIYLILRLLVIAAMIEQIINRNFENVFICIMTMFMFPVPSMLERRLHIILPDTLEIIILIFIFVKFHRRSKAECFRHIFFICTFYGRPIFFCNFVYLIRTSKIDIQNFRVPTYINSCSVPGKARLKN